MPAFSEGFGLPAAEALACGTPVIASSGGAVEEVIGAAGLFFDPCDPGDIARIIARIFSDLALHAALKARCLPRAATMSWTTAAHETLAILERVGSETR
jgi:glycosyltransferase involved in cell wall biosynthesis